MHDATNDDGLESARAAAAARQWPQAETLLTGYLAQHEGTAATHNLLGLILLNEDRPNDSLKEFTRGAKLEYPSAEDFRYVAPGHCAKGFGEPAAYCVHRGAGGDYAIDRHDLLHRTISGIRNKDVAVAVRWTSSQGGDPDSLLILRPVPVQFAASERGI